MSLTASTMLALGTSAPDFELPEPASGRMRPLEDLRGRRATLVMFLCNHCPYVKHVNAGLIALAQDYADHGVGIVAISSNDAEAYPQDGPDAMASAARTLGYPFPYLYDETQAVARAYHAACTPDFFLFDRDLRLCYRGQLDDTRPGRDQPVTGRDLRAALDAVLGGDAVPGTQRPSTGCNIKWRARG